MIIPTGIGASIGGFAGDAGPACRLLAKASDYLITHPNVVNAAVLTDIPKNVIVVEGYLLDRFFAHQIALRPNVRHKIAVVLDTDISEKQKEITQNCLNAAHSVYSIDCIKEIFYTQEAVAANLRSIGNPHTLLEACQRALNAGATALALLARIPDYADSETNKNYINGQGYDPIGFIEAKISHLVSREFLVPSAHAPILEPEFEHRGVVASKVAAEHLGITYLPSVFKCLQHAPSIIPLPGHHKILRSNYVDVSDDARFTKLKIRSDDIQVQDLANLIVPVDCCNSVPMVEAYKYNIELLCVENNTTTFDDPPELYCLKFRRVKNYLEAAGFLLANTRDQAFIDPELFLTLVFLFSLEFGFFKLFV